MNVHILYVLDGIIEFEYWMIIKQIDNSLFSFWLPNICISNKNMNNASRYLSLSLSASLCDLYAISLQFKYTTFEY